MEREINVNGGVDYPEKVIADLKQRNMLKHFCPRTCSDLAFRVRFHMETENPLSTEDCVISLHTAFRFLSAVILI